MAAKEKEEWYSDGIRFTCTQCGNCCSGPSGYVWFQPHEAVKMAAFHGMTVEAFLEEYAHRVDGRWTLNEFYNKSIRGYDCIFLARDDEGKALCTIYEARPQQCRTWPFWPDNLHTPRHYQQASKRCKGMIAGLKGEGRLYPIEQIRIIRDSNDSV